jgi:rubrerythrin
MLPSESRPSGRNKPEDRRPEPEPEDRPGDSVCWLRLVCPDCGSIAESEPPTDCPQCGARIEAGR